MKELLEQVVTKRKELENHIDNLTQKECEDLKLYEQLDAILNAESSIRKAFRHNIEAKRAHPESFSSIEAKPLEIA